MTVYGRDEFNDPVLRCDSCGALLLRTTLHQIGCCGTCGSRKVRNVQTYTSEELEQMKVWEIDPDFIRLFEPVEARA